MNERLRACMAPDSHAATPGSTGPSAIMAIMALSTSAPVSTQISSGSHQQPTIHEPYTSNSTEAHQQPTHVPPTLPYSHVSSGTLHQPPHHPSYAHVSTGTHHHSSHHPPDSQDSLSRDSPVYLTSPTLCSTIPLPSDVSDVLPDQIPATAPVSTSALRSGILFKGTKIPKRVTFRDSHLVNIRIIPPRSLCGSSSEDEGDDDDDNDDDDDDSDTSDSDDDSDDTDSDDEDGEEEGERRRNVQTKPLVGGRAAMTSRTTPSYPSSSSPTGTPRGRPSGPWTPTPNFPTTTAKGSYSVAASPASRVVALVSNITGVSSAASQAHLKQRCPAISPSSKHTPSPPSAAGAAGQSKKSVSLRTEKKVKRITPTLDSVMTSQTIRCVGAHAESSHKGSNSGGANGSGGGGVKTVKKKRVLHSLRRQEGGGDRRKTITPRKARDTKQSVVVKTNGMNASPAPPARSKGVVVNGFHGVRDSLTLPPLAGEDPPSSLSSRTPPSLRPVPKTPVYTLDGFIFPGDPAQDLTLGVMGVEPIQEEEDEEEEQEEKKLKPHAPPSALPLGLGQSPRDRVGSAPPGSPGRRKRYYAWQMANGNLQSSLKESPCITPMWETVTPLATLNTKSSHTSVADR